MAADPGKFPSEEECRLLWEEKGKPLFTRLWTYEELQVVERPGRPTQKKPAKDLETPANWPSDTVIDKTSKWVFWLPEGWQQGIRTSTAGKILKCYFTPEGRRFWHKKDIEKHIGYKLPSVEPPAKDEGGEKAKPRTRYVTDPDSIPAWPEDEEEWLPKDFKIAYRQLPSGLHRIFIPPGHDEIGFCYHRSVVMEYLSGGKASISPFGTSKPMANISAAALARGTSTSAKKARKQEKEGNRQASLDDYEPFPSFAALLLPASGGTTKSAAPPAELEKVAGEVKALLPGRGFPESTDFLVVFWSSEDSMHPVAKLLGGVYFRLLRPFNDRPVYQSIYLKESKLGCRGVYIFWNSKGQRWQIGALDEARAGFALLSEDCSAPTEASQPWMLLKESFREPEASQSQAE